jgi:electron transport complex protein RnfB
MNAPGEPAAVALIDEARCIGCARCIEVCPFDAIVGAAKFMHTVIAAECTGCRLCIPPCPVDCIEMRASGAKITRQQKLADAARARRRFEARRARLERAQAERLGARAPHSSNADENKRATVQRAIERARTRLRQRAAR